MRRIARIAVLAFALALVPALGAQAGEIGGTGFSVPAEEPVTATAAITRPLRRLSELRGWTPLRVFDEDELYGVSVRPD